MNDRTQQIKTASNKLAASIEECLAALRETVKQDDSLYVFALVASDDFSEMVGYANTKSHFANSGGSELDKWYFGEWHEQGLNVGFDSVLEILGEVEDADESPENGNAVDWLVAMSNAIKQLLEANASNLMPFVFASMTDSMNATWLEPFSAEYANGTSAYKPIRLEHQAAIKEWYFEYDPGVTVNPDLFESYKRLLIETDVE